MWSIFARDIRRGTISSSDSRLSFPNGALKAPYFSFSLSLPLNEGTTGKMDAVDVTRRKLGRIDTTIIHALRRLLCNRCARNRAIILELNAIIHESRTKYYGKYYAVTPCTRAHKPRARWAFGGCDAVANSEGKIDCETRAPHRCV